jgi:hypothetical protein
VPIQINVIRTATIGIRLPYIEATTTPVRLTPKFHRKFPSPTDRLPI